MDFESRLHKSEYFLNIPNTFLNGYMPIIKMVDDIVSAGPTYVQNLRVLHQRAKKQRK